MDIDTHQETPAVDSGLICLIMLARFHNISLSPEQLKHNFTRGNQLFTVADHLKMTLRFH